MPKKPSTSPAADAASLAPEAAGELITFFYPSVGPVAAKTQEEADQIVQKLLAN